jgi:hypothetical protein
MAHLRRGAITQKIAWRQQLSADDRCGSRAAILGVPNLGPHYPRAPTSSHEGPPGWSPRMQEDAIVSRSCGRVSQRSGRWGTLYFGD